MGEENTPQVRSVLLEGNRVTRTASPGRALRTHPALVVFTQGHLRVVLLPIVYNAMSQRESLRATGLFQALHRCARRRIAPRLPGVDDAHSASRTRSLTSLRTRSPCRTIQASTYRQLVQPAVEATQIRWDANDE